MKKVMMKIALVGALVAPLSMHAASISNADTTFEFFNKDNEVVRIAEFKVYGGSIKESNFAGNTLIQAGGGLVRAQIRVEDANAFLIFVEIRHGRGSYKYTIRPGHKTVFVSFNTEKSPSLYPQTGPLKGLLGKTESGLPLKNNLKAGMITQGDTRSTKEKIVGAFGSGW